MLFFFSKRIKHKKGSRATIGINRGYSVDAQDGEEDYDESYRPPYINRQTIIVTEHTVTSTDITDILNQEDEEEEEQVVQNQGEEVVMKFEQTEDNTEQ